MLNSLINVCGNSASVPGTGKKDKNFATLYLFENLVQKTASCHPKMPKLVQWFVILS